MTKPKLNPKLMTGLSALRGRAAKCLVARRKPIMWIAVPVLLVWLTGAELMPRGFEWYTGVRNGVLTYNTVQKLTNAQFEQLAGTLVAQARSEEVDQKVADIQDTVVRQERARLLMETASFRSEQSLYPHIDYFRKAGIREYTGPETCLKCHRTIRVEKPGGQVVTVDTMHDVMDTSHFKFQDETGFTTYGFDGRKVDSRGTRRVPVGKIDRACGIPGSFTWTGWAALVKTRPARLHGKVEMRSEGCGQCHIGGNYQPATELMLPGFKIPAEAKHGIDCLICHSATYDMNDRYVIKDKVGLRWNQDRSMSAAMTVGRPQPKNCLFCHQHNMGGDQYPYNYAAHHLGYKNPRMLHAGAKRGSPFGSHDDVHAAAGMNCLDCHVPQGHKIPRGIMGTDLVANDLPGVKVACENCHSNAPHTKNPVIGAILNGHVARVACETCHIKNLQNTSVVLRDWVHPTWDAQEGVYTYSDVYRNGEPGKGMAYLWFNGNGTFLANALGDNPNGRKSYSPLMNQIARITNPAVRQSILKNWSAFFRSNNLNPNTYLEAALDPLSQLSPAMLRKREAMIAHNLRPAMDAAPSKIYPFKMFNAMMYEDMGNQGPFGAMILPFDYPTYYETGNSYKAMEVAVSNPMVKRMYQAPFKYYMMDEFMRYFGVGTWNTSYPLDARYRKNIQPHWMRQMGTLMVNHGIQKEGRKCTDCHSPHGILDFKALGYSPARTRELEHLPQAKELTQAMLRHR